MATNSLLVKTVGMRRDFDRFYEKTDSSQFLNLQKEKSLLSVSDGNVDSRISRSENQGEADNEIQL